MDLPDDVAALLFLRLDSADLLALRRISPMWKDLVDRLAPSGTLLWMKLLFCNLWLQAPHSMTTNMYSALYTAVYTTANRGNPHPRTRVRCEPYLETRDAIVRFAVKLYGILTHEYNLDATRAASRISGIFKPINDGHPCVMNGQAVLAEHLYCASQTSS